MFSSFVVVLTIFLAFVNADNNITERCSKGPLKILLVGASGSGKSALVNLLRGYSIDDEISHTDGHAYQNLIPRRASGKVLAYDASINGTCLRIVDTPGYFDNNQADIADYIITSLTGSSEFMKWEIDDYDVVAFALPVWSEIISFVDFFKALVPQDIMDRVIIFRTFAESVRKCMEADIIADWNKRISPFIPGFGAVRSIFSRRSFADDDLDLLYMHNLRENTINAMRDICRGHRGTLVTVREGKARVERYLNLSKEIKEFQAKFSDLEKSLDILTTFVREYVKFNEGERQKLDALLNLFNSTNHHNYLGNYTIDVRHEKMKEELEILQPLFNYEKEIAEFKEDMAREEENQRARLQRARLDQSMQKLKEHNENEGIFEDELETLKDIIIKLYPNVKSGSDGKLFLASETENTKILNRFDLELKRLREKGKERVRAVEAWKSEIQGHFDQIKGVISALGQKTAGLSDSILRTFLENSTFALPVKIPSTQQEYEAIQALRIQAQTNHLRVDSSSKRLLEAVARSSELNEKIRKLMARAASGNKGVHEKLEKIKDRVKKEVSAQGIEEYVNSYLAAEKEREKAYLDCWDSYEMAKSQAESARYEQYRYSGKYSSANNNLISINLLLFTTLAFLLLSTS